MTATRPTGRARRIALAAVGLGVAALAVAPAASATSSSKSAHPVPAYAGGIVPPPGSTSVPPVTTAPGGTTPVKTPVTHVPGTKHHAAPVKHKHTTKKSTRVLASRNSASTLAYTGAEVGGVATTGLVLVVGGALLVRSGRRRSTTA